MIKPAYVRIEYFPGGDADTWACQVGGSFVLHPEGKFHRELMAKVLEEMSAKMLDTFWPPQDEPLDLSPEGTWRYICGSEGI
jgi:hypothetical protein